MHSIQKMLASARQKVFSGPFNRYEYADTVIRYFPIVNELINSRIPTPAILEIGSGSQGIAPYLPFNVTGLDLAFDGEVHPNLYPVIQSDTKVPFDDESFDYVVSVDMLEHVPPDGRLEVIQEMLRVARRKVFLAVPCGSSSEQQDHLLNELFFKSRGYYYSYLQEHVVNGLPKMEEINSLIVAAGKNKNIMITAMPNFNLRLRYFLMRLWAQEIFYIPYLMSSLIMCLIKSKVNYGCCYRYIFKIDIIIEE